MPIAVPRIKYSRVPAKVKYTGMVTVFSKCRNHKVTGRSMTQITSHGSPSSDSWAVSAMQKVSRRCAPAKRPPRTNGFPVLDHLRYTTEGIRQNIICSRKTRPNANPVCATMT